MTDTSDDIHEARPVGRTCSVFLRGLCVAKDIPIPIDAYRGDKVQLVFDDAESSYVVHATAVLESVPVLRCKT